MAEQKRTSKTSRARVQATGPKGKAKTPARTNGGRHVTRPDDLKWCAAFLAALRKTGAVYESARLARIATSRLYEFRRESREFAKLWRAARHAFSDSLRAEAQRQGVAGYLEPVYQGGKKVGQIRRRQPQVLLAMLRANCSEYRERIDHTVTIRENARKLAKAHGLNEEDADELIRVAERIAKGEESA